MPPTYSPPERRVDEGGAVLVWGPVIAWMVMWSALLAWHVDDAGITYAYARNAAEGLGFRAHAAAAPVEAFSNPAWTLVLTGASLLGVKAHVASKVLQCLLGAGTLVLLHRVVLRVGGERTEATGAAAVTAITAPFALWTAGGLETALLSFCLVAFFHAALSDRRGVGAGLAAGVAALARPEGPLLVVALFLAAQWLVPDPKWRRRRIVAGGIALAFWLSWAGFRIAVFGAWLPNAWWAKLHAPMAYRALDGAIYAAVFGAEVAIPILAVGLAAAWQIRRLAGLTRAALLVTFTGVVVVLYDGGDWMRHGRLLAPFVPMVAMACVPGLMALFFRPMDVGRTLLVGPARRVAWLFVIGFGAIQILFWQEALRHPPFPMSVVTETAQVFAGVGPSMCGESGLAVASPDVGGLLYDDPMHRVTDLGGITDAEAARARGRSYWVERLARDRPQLVLIHGVWVPRTGLDDGAMGEAGYRLLCRRVGTLGPSEARFPPSVYRRLDCDRPVPPEAMDSFDAWCARPR